MAYMDTRIPLMVEQFKLPDFAGIERQREADAQGRALYEERMAALQGQRRDRARSESEKERQAAEDAAHEEAIRANTTVGEDGTPVINKQGVVRDLATKGFGRRATELQAVLAKEKAEAEKAALEGRKVAATERRAEAAETSAGAAAARAEAAQRAADAALIRAERVGTSAAQSAAADRLAWQKERAAEQDRAKAEAAAAKKEEAEAARKAASEDFIFDLDKTLNQVRKVAGNKDRLAGATGVTGKVGGVWTSLTGRPTDRSKLESDLTSLKSQIALMTMQALKQASKTGATGFGALSNKELEVLQSKYENLDPTLLDDQGLLDNLKAMEQDVLEMRRKAVRRAPAGSEIPPTPAEKPGTGKTVTMDQVKAFARSKGLTYDQAVEQVESEGYKVQ